MMSNNQQKKRKNQRSNQLHKINKNVELIKNPEDLSCKQVEEIEYENIDYSNVDDITQKFFKFSVNLNVGE